MKFVVMYRVPVEVMQDWQKNTPPEEMKAQGEKIGKDMGVWIAKNDKAIVDKGLPLGKNTRVTSLGDGKVDIKPQSNDLNYYQVIEADTVEQVQEMVKDNPHLQIPGAFMDIMAVTHAGM